MNPTKRFVIEPSLVCNIKCKFCYHLHRYDTWKDTVKSLDQVKKEIDQGIERGNTAMDITGGEPTIYPHIIKVCEYAINKGLEVCIITNGIVSEMKTRELLNIGINDFLVSRHGLEATHNLITNTDDAYRKQIRFLHQINIPFRFNCVISKYNENDVFDIAQKMSDWKPRIVNFINMNPHHEWMEKDLQTKDVIADLRKVEVRLNKAIEYLEDRDIGVNVRYYPMCRISSMYYRTICNDVHVMFDPYEWDYQTTPKTIERYKKWGLDTSEANELQEKPCILCGIKNQCGGINKHFYRVTKIDRDPCDDISCERIENFYHYRQHNTRTLRRS